MASPAASGGGSGLTGLLAGFEACAVGSQRAAEEIVNESQQELADEVETAVAASLESDELNGEYEEAAGDRALQIMTLEMDAGLNGITEEAWQQHEEQKAADEPTNGDDSEEEDSDSDDEEVKKAESKHSLLKTIEYIKKGVKENTERVDATTESFKANLYAVKDAHNSLAPDDEQRDVLFGLTDAVLKLNQFVCNTSTIGGINVRETALSLIGELQTKVTLPVEIYQGKERLVLYQEKLQRTLRAEAEAKFEADERALEEKKRKRMAAMEKALAAVTELVPENKQKKGKRAKRARN